MHVFLCMCVCLDRERERETTDPHGIVEAGKLEIWKFVGQAGCLQLQVRADVAVLTGKAENSEFLCCNLHVEFLQEASIFALKIFC